MESFADLSKNDPGIGRDPFDRGMEGNGRGREWMTLLTFANVDTRARAVNGQRVSDDPSPAPLRRDAGKDEARSRWLR